ncbi:DNA-binding response regulator [Streptomyces sp. SS7]|uniref:helix-turn-helix transcriptional regulator n=1 Tax=Streptomyces sp. SS7 TaxID=3108485 RepID=UPI0030EE08C8
MPQTIFLHSDLELRTRVWPLVEPDETEWVNIAHDLDTWPGARESARRRMNGERARRARKLYSPTALADERDRDVLREMAAQGIQVRVTAAPVPRGTAFIDRRTMILTGPASGASGRRDRTYTLSTEPALVSGAYALFEAAWETATDLAAFLAADRPHIDARARSVLRTLSSGATDAAAARELGMSLRTYRRRVAELLAVLGAESRFQAGLRAAELGLARG